MSGERQALLAGHVQAAAPKGRRDHGSTSDASDTSDTTPTSSGGLAGGVFNLSNTMLGGGISLVALPLALQQSGAIGYVGLLLTSALLTNVSLKQLWAAATATHSHSYGEVAVAALGRRGEAVVQAFVLLINFGACTALLNTCGDVLPGELHAALAHHHPHRPPWADRLVSRDVVVALLTCAVLLPATARIRRIGSLRFLSLAALALCVLFLGFMVEVLAMAQQRRGHGHGPGPGRESLAGPSFWTRAPPGVLAFLGALSAMSFSFTCHFNAVTIFRGLDHESHAWPVIHTSTSVSALLYLGVGLVGGITHPDSTAGDILDDYAQYPGAAYFRSLFVAAIALSFPLFAFEGTITLDALVLARLCGAGAASGGVEGADGTGGGGGGGGDAATSGGEDPTWLEAVDSDTGHGRRRRVLAAVLFTLGAAAVSLALPQTGLVISFVGAAFGIPLMYVFPPLLYLCVCRGEGSGKRGEAVAMLAVGCVVCAACLVSSIAAFVAGS